MNREIKFRGWNNMHKSIAEHKCRYSYGHEPDFWYWVEHQGILGDHVTVHQYTGIKDKNGKEIYEGDIIVSLHPREPKNDKYVIGWDYGSFSCISLEDGLQVNICFWSSAEMEVVGNIFETPEFIIYHEILYKLNRVASC